MSIETVIVGSSEQMGFEGKHHYQFHGCYGYMFTKHWNITAEGFRRYKYSSAIFRLEALPLEVANWYLDTVLVPAIPERLRPHVLIQPLIRKQLDSMEIVKIPYASTRLPKETPWCMVWFDDDECLAEDVFILLNQLRVPVEVSSIVQSAYDIHQKGVNGNQVTPQEAYMIAAFQFNGHWGHTFITNQSLRPTNWQHGLPNFTLTKKWLSTPLYKEGKVTWGRSTDKQKSIVDANWAQRLPSGRLPDYYARFYASVLPAGDLLAALRAA